MRSASHLAFTLSLLVLALVGTSAHAAFSSDEETQLRNILKCVKYVPADADNEAAIIVGDTFGGCNLRVVNGTNNTYSNNGAGNLIMGYGTNASGWSRSGSHNIIVGNNNGYSHAGNLIVGTGNRVSSWSNAIIGTANSTSTAAFTGVLGGIDNDITATYGAAVGGSKATVSGLGAAAIGGETLGVAGQYSVAVGGNSTVINAGAIRTVVVGGYGNDTLTASVDSATVIGGFYNHPMADMSVIVGGQFNQSQGELSVIVGGETNKTVGELSFAVGSHLGTAEEAYSGVVGGLRSHAYDPYAMVVGGSDNRAYGDYALQAGGFAKLTFSASQANIAGTTGAP